VALPILARTEEATALARMLIADLKQAVGTLQQQATRPGIPYLVLMDEASSYVNVEGVERLFEQARSAGLALVVAAQVASGFAMTSRQQQDFIFGNTATKVIMSLGDFPSADTMAKTIGEEIALFGTTSSATNTGQSASWISPLPDRSNKSNSESRGAQERYDYVVRPEQFMQQRTGQAVVYVRDPSRGGMLYTSAQLTYLDLPITTFEDPLPPPATNTPGLNLLKVVPRSTPAPRRPPRRASSNNRPTAPPGPPSGPFPDEPDLPPPEAPHDPDLSDAPPETTSEVG